MGISDYSGPRYKIVLIGDGGVGKTALMERIQGYGFKSIYNITIGANISVTDISVEDRLYKFQIWDLAGQKRFIVVRGMFYRGSHAAILVYDQSRQESFNNLERWKRELYTKVRQKIPILIIGNKNDLKKNDVPRELLQNYIKKCNSEYKAEKIKYEVPFLSTSALTGNNVNLSIEVLASCIRSYVENNEIILRLR